MDPQGRIPPIWVGRFVRIIIASRKSDLARIQAQSVGEALKKKNPELKIEYNFRESLGDKNLQDPLWKMPEKGVFTQDFYDDLISSKVDMVVHSWKDLPIEERSETQIVATLPRADQRDLLLVKKSSWEGAKAHRELKVFSSSPRRAYNLEGFLREVLPGDFENVSFESVRGNVPTRVQKLNASDSVHGLIVAKAAIDRLLSAQGQEYLKMQRELREVLKNCLVMVLPLEKNPSAAAQGALAIEIKTGRQEILQLLEGINCKKTFSEVREERKRLKEYGGGCHQKVGISVRVRDYGEIVYTRAFTDQNIKVDKVEFYSATQKISKATLKNIFPEPGVRAQFFRREALDIDIPPGPLWVSKDEALPDGVVPQDRLIWVSGIETWKKLAKRGVWVTGCNEGLGESEANHLEDLFGPLKWTKLSHTEGHQGQIKSLGKILGTYKLIPLKTLPDLQNKTHFYWTSGSSFLLALKAYPEIKKAHHFCGPGNTYEIISKEVPVTIFPKYEQWKEAILK